MAFRAPFAPAILGTVLHGDCLQECTKPSPLSVFENPSRTSPSANEASIWRAHGLSRRTECIGPVDARFRRWKSAGNVIESRKENRDQIFGWTVSESRRWITYGFLFAWISAGEISRRSRWEIDFEETQKLWSLRAREIFVRWCCLWRDLEDAQLGVSDFCTFSEAAFGKYTFEYDRHCINFFATRSI